MAKAREMVEEMRRQRDTDGTDAWLRMIVAIGTLGTPTDAPLIARSACPTCKLILSPPDWETCSAIRRMLVAQRQ
jgi:hypothetical protein